MFCFVYKHFTSVDKTLSRLKCCLGISADGRRVIWSANMEAVKENPAFGAGYGRFAAGQTNILLKNFPKRS